MSSALATSEQGRPEDRAAVIRKVAEAARAAARIVAKAPAAQRTAAIQAIGVAIEAQATEILAGNARDLAAGEAAGLSAAMLDRLKLDPKRVAGLARAVAEVAAAPDLLGAVAPRTLLRGEGEQVQVLDRLSAACGVDSRIQDRKSVV